MGRLVNGRWQAGDSTAPGPGGGFARPSPRFRGTIAPGTRHAPAPGRYHLYISLACPWAHRTLIMRRLKGLERIVGLSVVHWFMGDEGWNFAPGPGVVPDPVQGAHALHELYARAEPDYSGRVTVPVLWDRAADTIVNNESPDILRLFNSAFDGIGAAAGDYYPEALRPEIDAVNERVYATVNNGVYQAGFARSQAAYDEAIGPLFDTLDWLEARLTTQPFLVGDRFTEADIRLFTTLVRFDTVYHGHFKCNRRRLVDYPSLWDFCRTVFQMPAVRDTVDFGHIARHYYKSHASLNPSRIVPVGPALDWEAPTARRVA